MVLQGPGNRPATAIERQASTGFHSQTLNLATFTPQRLPSTQMVGILPKSSQQFLLEKPNFSLYRYLGPIGLYLLQFTCSPNHLSATLFKAPGFGFFLQLLKQGGFFVALLGFRGFVLVGASGCIHKLRLRVQCFDPTSQTPKADQGLGFIGLP